MVVKRFGTWVLIGVATHFASGAELPAPAKRKVDFVKDVQPILESRCYECHGAA